MNKPVTYAVKTQVTKSKTTWGSDEYTVVVEGSGFTGEATGIFLGQTFEKAYEDLMAKVSEAIFKNDV